jgi:DNA-binding GntR family transcriptional regulator
VSELGIRTTSGSPSDVPLPHTTLRPGRPASVVEYIAESLREAILDGTVAPGDRIVERQVADVLGVSTIAVREAFGLLRVEGFVVRIQRRGTFVATVGSEFIRDVTRVRIVLEQLAAELAAERWDTGHAATARTIVDEMAELVEHGGSRKRLFDLDLAFHRVFWQAAGSDTLLGVLDNLQGRIGRSRFQVWAGLARDELLAVVRMHREWLETVESGDIPRVRAAVAAHISSAGDHFIAAMHEAPSTT